MITESPRTVIDVGHRIADLAVQADPTNIQARLTLGAHLTRLNLYDQAEAQFLHILDRLDPNCQEALLGLADLHIAAKHYDQAAHWYQRLLTLDPTHGPARHKLVNVLEIQSRLTEAQQIRHRLARPLPLIRQSAPNPVRSVLILLAIGSGSVVTRNLIPATRNDRLLWCIELSTQEQENSLPAYDVVFNAIGNAEFLPPALPNLNAFMDRCPKPILNPPERVALTRRDRMPALLGGIPDVVIPTVIRLTREDIASGLMPKLAAGGIAFPFLTRPIAGQEGHCLTLIATEADLASVDFSTPDASYFVAYHDSKSTDGYFRKYRTVFIDRQPFPCHLAISDHWLVHFFSADMLNESWKRDEERRFLENPGDAIGPRAFEALSKIGQRLDMDYCGIDYSILPDGRILVFEANATMNVSLPEASTLAYKHGPVTAIFAAFDAMLEKHGCTKGLTGRAETMCK